MHSFWEVLAEYVGVYAVLPITLEMVEGEPHTHHGLDTHTCTHIGWENGRMLLVL